MPHVAALSPADHDAFLYWLDAHGGGPLHAQGATGAQIGVPYDPVDDAIVAAPWPGTVPLLPAQPPLRKPTPAPVQHHRSCWSLVAAVALPAVIAPVEHSSSSSTSTSPDGSIADPTDPFAGAFAIGYAIRHVTYADGTAWNEPGANPWPRSGGTS